MRFSKQYYQPSQNGTWIAPQSKSGYGWSVVICKYNLLLIHHILVQLIKFPWYFYLWFFFLPPGSSVLLRRYPSPPSRYQLPTDPHQLSLRCSPQELPAWWTSLRGWQSRWGGCCLWPFWAKHNLQINMIDAGSFTSCWFLYFILTHCMRMSVCELIVNLSNSLAPGIS